MSDLPILARIEASKAAELERLKRVAASGLKGAVAARAGMQRLRNEQLREALRS